MSNYSLRESTIIDKTAIVYRRGSKLYVNRPRAGATSRLNDDDILLTKITGSQLGNKVDLIDHGSRMWSGFVSLGGFVSYERVRTSAR